MKKPPQESRWPSSHVATSRGYEDYLPASVPDAQESDSESVWAMFQQSIIHTEERVAVAAELAVAKAKDDAASAANSLPKAAPAVPERESGFADTTFENTNFSVPPYDATEPAPLQSEGQ